MLSVNVMIINTGEIAPTSILTLILCGHNQPRIAHGNVVTMLDKMEDAFYNLEKHSGTIYIAAGLGYRPFSEGMFEERMRADKDSETWEDILAEIHTKYQQDSKVHDGLG